MYEDTFDPGSVRSMVCGQIELLHALGARYLILTCAVGGLTHREKEGDIVIIEDFMSWGNEVMPIPGNKFVSPTEALDHRLRFNASDSAATYHQSYSTAEHHLSSQCNVLHKGIHMYFRGRHFESNLDKKVMSDRGATVVGMSVKPECCVAAVYKIPTLALGLVTNDIHVKVVEHEKHLEVAKSLSEPLGAYLTAIIAEEDDMRSARMISTLQR